MSITQFDGAEASPRRGWLPRRPSTTQLDGCDTSPKGGSSAGSPSRGPVSLTSSLASNGEHQLESSLALRREVSTLSNLSEEQLKRESTLSAQLSMAGTPRQNVRRGSRKFSGHFGRIAEDLVERAGEPKEGVISTFTLWAITVSIPLLLGIVNWAMVSVDSVLLTWRLQLTLAAVQSGNVFYGAVVAMAIGGALATLAAALVFFVAPICAGSGLPEAKGYLNGSAVADMFDTKNFLVRVCGVVLSVSSGLPVGREGPMVCIGGGLGIGVVWFLGLPHLTRWVCVVGKRSAMEEILLQEEQFARAKRVGCVLGGAAGIACAFNAPVGAILYMFEEVTIAAWPPEITFRVFVCTALAACSSQAVAAIGNELTRRLLIYEHEFYGVRGWEWHDMPMMFILAVAVGLCNACFTRALKSIYALRKKVARDTEGLRRWRYYRIWDVTLYAMFCGCVMVVVPMLAACTTPNGDDGDASERAYVQYTCEAGEYNQIATLLLSGTEGATKHLFSRSAEHFDVAPLAVSVGVFLVLCAGTAGLLAPMGLFVPCMFIGGMMGRLVGEALHHGGYEGAHPGVFALVGSAAMLGGFTHMTIAIVVLLIEAAQDLSVVIPIMFAIFVSHVVSSVLVDVPYDEHLIRNKRIPFLDSEIPKVLEPSKVTAEAICTLWPLRPDAELFAEAPMEAVEKALKVPVSEFPVVDDAGCVLGLVSRTRLQQVLGYMDAIGVHTTSQQTDDTTSACCARRPPTPDLPSVPNMSCRGSLPHIRRRRPTTVFQDSESITDGSPFHISVKDYLASRLPSHELNGGGNGDEGANVSIPVGQIMDRSPPVIQAECPMTRFYPLFTEIGWQAACVVGGGGTLVGVLSRTTLIRATQKEGLRAIQDLVANEASCPRDLSPRNTGGIRPGRISERVHKTQPRQHRLPTRVIWAVTLIIPLLVGTTNYVMVLADASMVGWKLQTVQSVFSNYGVIAGALALAMICCCFVSVAVCSVVFGAPICAGSGLPEAKGYLNGNYVPDMFEPINLYVRVVGVVFAVAAGLPIGREGPMVCIGGCLGIGAVHVLAGKHVYTSAEMDQGNSMDFIDEERFRHAKRIGCILGGASGIAAAFGAPVGGILYMFEEVTVSSWPSELTFRVFICTVLASLVSQGLLNITGRDVHRLILWNREAASAAMKWDYIDLPFFVLLAVICGLWSALFTKGMVGTWLLRKKIQGAKVLKSWQPYPKLWDTLIYTALCALIFGVVPAFFECVPVGDNALHAHRRLRSESADGHTDGYVVHTCPEGTISEVATLLLSGAEGAVKQLYSRDSDSHLSLGALGVTFAVYSLLAMGVSGLAVPMGAFVPSMLMGAVMGRLVGESVMDQGVSQPGLYALVGSAAMLSGFTRMTIAIVMLLVESTKDLSAMLPLMLGIFVSQCVSRAVATHDFSDEMIARKGIAFLDPTLPNKMSGAEVTAAVLHAKPQELPPLAPISKVVRALRQSSVPYFPVVLDNRVCIGLVPRARLMDAMWATVLQKNGQRTSQELLEPRARQSQGASPGRRERNDTFDRAMMMTHVLSGTSDADGVSETPPNPNAHVLVSAIMDPAPYTVLSDMPVAFFYRLFTRAGSGAVCIISRRGAYDGVISRADLIDATQEAQPHEHGCWPFNNFDIHWDWCQDRCQDLSYSRLQALFKWTGTSKTSGGTGGAADDGVRVGASPGTSGIEEQRRGGGSCFSREGEDVGGESPPSPAPSYSMGASPMDLALEIGASHAQRHTVPAPAPEASASPASAEKKNCWPRMIAGMLCPLAARPMGR